MPEGCFDCPFERDYAFICSLTNKETRKQRKEHDVNEYEAMPEWCPLVEVPTPHGRLIDADQLIQCLNNCMIFPEKQKWTGKDIITLLKNRPTIIKLEKEEEYE